MWSVVYILIVLTPAPVPVLMEDRGAMTRETCELRAKVIAVKIRKTPNLLLREWVCVRRGWRI